MNTGKFATERTPYLDTFHAVELLKRMILQYDKLPQILSEILCKSRLNLEMVLLVKRCTCYLRQATKPNMENKIKQYMPFGKTV